MISCGSPPIDLGLVDLNPTEMMFWMYCPIKIPYGQIYLPENLEQFKPLVSKVIDSEYVGSSYIYITAKTLWVSGEYIGNRPGWHIDGFGTEDLNFIWYDRAPTEFLLGNFELPEDCDESMEEMNRLHESMMDYDVDKCPIRVKEYPNKTLLKLDQRVIHRCPVYFEPGMRTFIKISVSKDPYDLVGNSINPHFGEIFDKKPRRENRNHPSTKFNSFSNEEILNVQTVTLYSLR